MLIIEVGLPSKTQSKAEVLATLDRMEYLTLCKARNNRDKICLDTNYKVPENQSNFELLHIISYEFCLNY